RATYNSYFKHVLTDISLLIKFSIVFTVSSIDKLVLSIKIASAQAKSSLKLTTTHNKTNNNFE
ncbi:MAG: hypothetical protein Q8736_02415, partial [Sweet potato little leaf phytoplasma]|nr:hypothetical protein [Sweet potato little leaf phytoplasma]